MIVNWGLVEYWARLIGNGALSVPMLVAGILYVWIGFKTKNKYASRLGWMGFWSAIYNIIAGIVYFYTNTTGNFVVFNLPAGLFYSVPNMIDSLATSMFYAGALGWFGARIQNENKPPVKGHG